MYQACEFGCRRRWYVNRAVGGALRGVCEVDPASRGAAERVSGSFDWLRTANDARDREARLKLFELTDRIVENRGFVLKSSHTVPLRYATEAQKGTCVVSPTVGRWGDGECADEAEHVAGSAGAKLNKTEVTVAQGVVLAAAAERIKAGRHVVAVNAASAFSCGGGVARGSRHALEEAMCIQTTLYSCLASHRHKYASPEWVSPATRRDGAQWEMHIPNDGAILSPSVEIFRKGTFDGYAVEDTATRLEGIVSVAMPNRNTKMGDSPTDAHPDLALYATQVEQKWRAVLVAASFCAQADSLVLPDAGCGVFYNDPAVIGGALGHLLRSEFAGRFAEVVLAFPGMGGASRQFADAALAVYGGTAQWPPPSAPPLPPVPAATQAASRPSRDAAPAKAPREQASNPSGAPAVWEFSVQSGFQQFDQECQGMVEAAYQTFLSLKEPPVARIPSRGKFINVDFTQFVQWIDGNNRVRKVRRRAL